MTKKIRVRDMYIGGDSPVSIQSMTNTNIEDVKSTLEQIAQLKEAGCEIIRLAVPNMKAAEAFSEVRKKVDMPMVADIHFDYRLAIAAMEAGADKIRINPGNIGSIDRVKMVVDVAKERRIPIRIGVNSGSLEKEILEKYGSVTAIGLAESAIKSVKIVEDLDYDQIVISLKASNPKMNYDSVMELSKMTEYPLHIGVTEAGTVEKGKIKSAVGIGGLLLAGIGDTIRVSLTGDPVNEIFVAKNILASCGLRQEAIDFISCPTCGRTKIDLNKLTLEIEKELVPVGNRRLELGLRPLTVAVMGCIVNGPGEASNADLGVAGGVGEGLLFINGKSLKKVKESEIKKEIINLVENYEKYI